MKPHLSGITLGVEDVERAKRFYSEGLGWPIAMDAQGDPVHRLHRGLGDRRVVRVLPLLERRRDRASAADHLVRVDVARAKGTQDWLSSVRHPVKHAVWPIALASGRQTTSSRSSPTSSTRIADPNRASELGPHLYEAPPLRRAGRPREGERLSSFPTAPVKPVVAGGP